MKTVRFNAEQAKAGRPIYCHLFTDKLCWLVHAGHAHAWVETRQKGQFVVGIAELCHPADPAPGHNPAGLDEWTVGVHEGWRLLEAGELSIHRELTLEIQEWDSLRSNWTSQAFGGYERATYRTLRPAGYFLPKVVTRNLRPDEFAGDIIVRTPRHDARSIIRHEQITEEYIRSAAPCGAEWSRSLDGPWKPFTVEETK